MKYRLFAESFRFSGVARRDFFFFILFSGVFIFPHHTIGQSSYWGITGDLGASLHYTKGDTLTKQELFLPAAGLAVEYGKVISHGLSLKATLGYRSRGGVATVNSVINASTGSSLGKYSVHARDHFITNDIALRLNARYWKVAGLIPFLDLGVRNDLYVLTNSKVSSDDLYYQPESNAMNWYRNRHHKPYVVGLTANTGVFVRKFSIGLEYYHQILGSFSIPAIVRSNYAQINSRSLQVRVGYRF